MQKATETIKFRLTPEEKREIELLAKESNLKMSEFIRRQVFRSEKFREMLTTVVKAIEKDTTKNDYKFTEEN